MTNSQKGKRSIRSTINNKITKSEKRWLAIDQLITGWLGFSLAWVLGVTIPFLSSLDSLLSKNGVYAALDWHILPLFIGQLIFIGLVLYIESLEKKIVKERDQ